MKKLATAGLWLWVVGPGLGAQPAAPGEIRGIHWMAPAPADVPLLVEFIREVFPKEGVNVLVLEINFQYQFRSQPELAGENALGRDDVKQIVEVCRTAGVRLIPLLNCLGHQSWAEKNNPLLTHYPEFDETPGQYPNNEGIYCRSYCPRHPRLHEVLFRIIDELIDVFEADAFHVGMDEVFLLGEDDCARCRGRDRAQLFADEVRKLHRHLSSRRVGMWMWGDRLLDGELTGAGKWEGALNGTAPAIDELPLDILICDWHYEVAVPTASYFAMKGFDVVSSPWRKPDVALAQLELINWVRRHSNARLAARMRGVLHTTWTNPARFIRAYHGEETDNEAARESAETFKTLFAALRKSNE